MKTESVKFGEIVAAKLTCKMVRVSAVLDGGIFCGEVARADQYHPNGHKSNAWCADAFRKPRLKDLRKGDVFEFDIRRPARFSVEEATPISIKVKVHKDSKEGTSLMDNEFFLLIMAMSTPGSVAPSTKLNVTEKKPEPRKGEVDVYLNIGPTGRVTGFGNAKATADSGALSSRIACVKATVSWTEGQFDE